MAVLGTFSSFTTARLGIYASQASLNVTGNNIANINTTGYTRQRMDLVSLYSKGAGKYANIFNRNVGYGVLAETRTQLRDPFLDIRYRNENTNLAANTEKYNGLYQLSHTLDEVNKGTDKDEGYGVIQANLKNFVTALEKLHANVGSQEFDRQVRGEAESLTTFFKEAAKALQSVYDGKKEEFTQTIKETNLLLTDIRDLNEQIRTAALYGDNALELRDQRNLDLDKLSEMMHINVEYSMERVDQFTEVEKLTVTIAGSKGPDGKPIKLIDGIYGAQISLQEREPQLNPNADASKILAAKDQAQADAEAAFPITDQMIEERVTLLRDGPNGNDGIDAANPITESPWKERLEALEEKKIAEKVKEAEESFTDTTTDAEKEAALKKAEEDGKKAAQDALDDEWETEMQAKAERLAKKELKAEQQEAINNAVANDPNLAQAVETYGKYLKKDGTATNDLYKKNADGSIVYEDGKPVYADDVMTYENEKFLLQVDPLKDRRERLMIDSSTVSKKSEVVELNDTVLYGKIQSQRELLTEEGEYASETDLNKNTDPPRLSGDPDASSKRGIPFYQKALNSLARQFAEEFNQANQLPATTVYQMNQATAGTVADTDTFKDADGNPLEYTYTAADGTTQTKQITVKDVTKEVEQEKRDENGNVVLDPNGDPVMEKVRVPYTLKDVANGTITEEEYAQAGAMLNVLAEKGVKDPLYEFYDGGVLFSNNGNTNDPSNITASNITISHGWATETVHILNDKRPDSYREDGSVIHHTSRNENIQHMITLFDKQLEYDARDMQADSAATLPIFKGSFREVYTTIEGILGTEQNITGGKMDNYQLMTLNLENDRQSVSGVDLNDEAMNMMQYQKAYSAACRLMTAVDEALDRLINNTGIAGR